MKTAWTDTGAVALIEDGNTAWLDRGAIYLEPTPSGSSSIKSIGVVTIANVKQVGVTAIASIKQVNVVSNV